MFSRQNKAHISGTFPNVTSCTDRYHSILPRDLSWLCMGADNSSEASVPQPQCPGNVMNKEADGSYTSNFIQHMLERIIFMEFTCAGDAHGIAEAHTFCEC